MPMGGAARAMSTPVTATAIDMANDERTSSTNVRRRLAVADRARSTDVKSVSATRAKTEMPSIRAARCHGTSASEGASVPGDWPR